MSKHFSLLTFWICAIFIAVVVLTFPRYKSPATEATIAWDVSGYYLYLPAIFIYHDLKGVDFLSDIIEKYQPSYSPDQAFEYGEGIRVMKYSAGMALCYLPFFLLGHLAAYTMGYPPDGFSLPYQVAIHLGSVLVAILGLWFLRKNLLHFFNDRITGFTLLLIALGTNFLNYATFDAAMPHVYLFLLLVLLLHFTIRWHERPNLRDAIYMGCCVGLAALVRPTELIFAIVPVFWGITGVKTLKEKLALFTQHIPHLLLAGTIVAAIGLIQPFYWKMITGEWIVYSYQDQGFNFLHPHVTDVLFSYRKGWLVYTPLMLFALAGFYFLIKKIPLLPLNRKFGLGSPGISIPLFLLIEFWVVASWDIWWYGGAFGQRAMIPSYVLLAFPLAALLHWLVKAPPLVASTARVLLAGCVALNFFQTYQAHWGPWEADMMNRAYFWQIFAKLEDNPYDKLLLDTKEGYAGERKNKTLVYSTDFENLTDTTGLSTQRAYSGRFSLYLDQGHSESAPVFIPKTGEMQPGKRLHILANFSTPQLELEPWWMPQLVVQFEHAGTSIRERILRPGRILPVDEWRSAWMDLKIPNRDFDRLKIFLRNPRNRVSLFMDDLTVEVY